MSKVLIACEESQAATIEMRALGIKCVLRLSQVSLKLWQRSGGGITEKNT